MSTYEDNNPLPNEPSYPTAETLTGSLEKRDAFTLTVTWETVLWIALSLSAFATRFWALGARVMSHDESLHVYYSWLLSKGSGFAHNPMMHGPFLFESTALFNVFFGASDFTSRLVPALLGIGIVIGIPLLLRPWLGKAGAVITGLFFLVSPYILFYSRYNRHDIQVIAWMLLAVFAMLSYLRERQDRSLVLLAVALALMISTMEISFIYLAIFASFLIMRIMVTYRFHWPEIRRSAEFDLLIVLVSLGALFSSPIALVVLNPIWSRLSGQPFVDLNVLNVFDSSWSAGPGGIRLWGLMAIFGVGAAAAGILWDWRRWLKLAAIFLGITVPLFTTFFTNQGGIGTGFIGSLGYWLSQQGVARGSQPLYYYLIVFPLYEYLPLLVGIAALIYYAIRRRHLSDTARIFVPLAGWWGLLMFTGLSLAGEKMPWLSTHITIPFILLSGWLAGRLAARGWRELSEQKRSLSWQTWAPTVPLALLLFLTIRTSYMVNYINYDYTTEFIGYAHGAPGVKWVVDDIDRIAKRLGQGQEMKVASDSGVSWPMTWYLRNYSGFFGDQPSRAALENAQVIVVSPQNWQKVDSYVGSEYSRYEVIRMWWPIEDYKDLNWSRIRNALTDPQMRQALWNIIWSRDYSLYGKLTKQDLDPPNKWTPDDLMRVYIRKDIASQVVGLKLQDSQIPDLPTQDTVFAGKEISPQPIRTLLLNGLTAPRNLVVTSSGSAYILDSGNSRVLKIDSTGKILASWGSRTPEGQVPAAAGTFNDPWGIAVDGQGNVYVADTWNHRIQKFDENGGFLLQWGIGGQSTEGPDRFWGPRGLAISADGNVYVTDTGNRRVAVFDPQGKYLFQFDQQGEAQLDEPVGIAIGKDQRVYVADTWNKRVAVFSLAGKFELGWPVAGWNSISIDDKPYLSLDEQGDVYLTDPEGYRVLIFSKEGTPVAAFGRIGDEENSFNLPTGISVSSQGEIWIADTGNNRVAIYPPLQP